MFIQGPVSELRDSLCDPTQPTSVLPAERRPPGTPCNTLYLLGRGQGQALDRSCLLILTVLLSVGCLYHFIEETEAQGRSVSFMGLVSGR